MGDLIIRRVVPGADTNRFIDVAHACQSHDPHWVAPMRFIERDRLNPKKNPWFKHGEAAFWIAERDGQLAGRISAQVDHSHLV